MSWLLNTILRFCVRSIKGDYFYKLISQTEFFLAGKPVVDIAMQSLSKIRQLRKVILAAHNIQKGSEIAAKGRSKGLTDVVADHRNIHRDQETLKGGVSAPLNGIPEFLPGFFARSVQVDNLIPIIVQSIDIRDRMQKP